MYCMNCGEEIKDGAKFCGSCGTDVEAAEELAEELAEETVSEEVDAGSAEGHSSRTKIIAIVLAVIGVAIVVGIVAFVLWSQEQARLSDERLTEVQQIMTQYEENVAAIEVDTSDAAERGVLLQQYETADAELVAIQEAAQGDELVLFDGSVYDTSYLEDELRQKMDDIRQWFIADYEERIAADTLPGDASGDNTSRESCQALLDDLAALLAQMEQETIIWNGETGEGSQYAQLVAKVNEATTRDNDVLQQIAEREQREEQEKLEQLKAKQPIGRWRGSYNGMTYYIGFNQDGTFYQDMVDHVFEGTWKRTGQNADGSSTYESFVASGYSLGKYTYDPVNDALSSEDGTRYTRA